MRILSLFLCSFFLLLSLDAQILIWKDGQVICQCDGYESFDSVTIMTVVEEPVISEFESENTDYSESEEVVNDIVEEVVDYIEEEEVVNYDVDDDIDIEEDYYDNNITREVLIGTINGLYSVSETNRVYFSQGNLRYHIEQNIWRFADTQYDIVGFENNRIGFEEVGWIDLFGWGLSGYNGKMPNLTKLYPSDYVDLMAGINGTQYDWGVYNAIENGGNKAGLWRTLTKDEWNYLINKRPNAKELCSHGSVNGVWGIILLPDDFICPEDLFFTPNSNSYYANDYTEEEWIEMEKKGAVFLPASGYRIATNISNMGKCGSYWSSSVCNSGPYYFDFTQQDMYACYSINFSYAFSVRLVKDFE